MTSLGELASTFCLSAKKKITAKQTIGTKYDNWMLPPVALEILPINKGKKAPPTMDITRNEEAIFVSSPRRLIPSANIVGNIIDIKNGTHINAYTATFPFVNTASESKRILTTAYIPSKRSGLIYFIKKVPA